MPDLMEPDLDMFMGPHVLRYPVVSMPDLMEPDLDPDVLTPHWIWLPSPWSISWSLISTSQVVDGPKPKALSPWSISWSLISTQ
jgi:hypothetical protein